MDLFFEKCGSWKAELSDNDEYHVACEGRDSKLGYCSFLFFASKTDNGYRVLFDTFADYKGSDVQNSFEGDYEKMLQDIFNGEYIRKQCLFGGYGFSSRKRYRNRWGIRK